MIILPALLLLFLFAAPGTALWLHAGPQLRAELNGAERFMVILLAGVALVGWLALVLASFNRFSLPLLVVLVTVVSAAAASTGWRRHGAAPLRQWRLPPAVLWLLLFLFLALLLSPRPSEYIIGGRDHGVYVNTGIHIAETGGILIYDRLLPQIPQALQPLLVRPETRTWQAGFPGSWSMGQHLTGLTIRDLAAGINLPHAFHFYPALIAVFAAAGGVPLALWTTPLLMLLGFASFFLFIHRLWGVGPAVFAGTLLLVSVTQVWFAGYPTAEAVMQPFFWGGLLMATVMLGSEERWPALFAGAAFGILHLAKMDTFHLPFVLLPFGIYLWLRGRYRPAHTYFWIVYSLLLLHALLHAFLVATTYFLDHLLRSLLPSFLAEPLAAIIGGLTYPGPIFLAVWREWWPWALAAVTGLLLILLLLRRVAPAVKAGFARVNWRALRPRWGVLILLAGYGTAVTAGTLANTTAPGMASLLWAADLTMLYITRPGFILVAVALFMLVVRSRRLEEGFFLWLVIGSLLPIYLLGAGTAPDHFWVIRRYIPIAFPFFFAAISMLLWQLWRETRQLHRLLQLPWLSLLVLLLLAGRLWLDTAPIRAVVEYDGLTAQLTELSAALPEDAVLLMQPNHPATRLEMPLWLIYGHPVYQIEPAAQEEPLLETAVEALTVTGRPVYWLLPAAQTPPGWPHADIRPVATFDIDSVFMETPLDRIPRRLLPYQLQLTAYRITFPTEQQ